MGKKKATSRAKPMVCLACKKDLTAVAFKGPGGLLAPYRVVVVINYPREGDKSAYQMSLSFCEACKDIPHDALAYMKMQKNERNPDVNAPRSTETPFLKLA